MNYLPVVAENRLAITLNFTAIWPNENQENQCIGLRWLYGDGSLRLCDTLLLANRVAKAIRGAASEPLFDVRVASLIGGTVFTAGGLAIGTGKFRASQVLLVIPGMDIGDRDCCTQPLEKLAAEVTAIARTLARGAPIASTCVGAFSARRSRPVGRAPRDQVVDVRRGPGAPLSTGAR